jgi:hypothetical protein
VSKQMYLTSLESNFYTDAKVYTNPRGECLNFPSTANFLGGAGGVPEGEAGVTT